MTRNYVIYLIIDLYCALEIRRMVVTIIPGHPV